MVKELETYTKIGDYRIHKKLASGGMADIYLCNWEGPEGVQKQVALKAHKSTDADSVKEFIREAQLSCRLSHPNLPQYFDFFEHEGTFYLIMEYVHGASLKEVDRHCKESYPLMPPTLVAYVGTEVARALHYIHQLSDAEPLHLVHRDVKPGNVLLSFGGVVKLIDLGIAKHRTSDTAPNVLKGTSAYMSPEQVEGKPLDPRSDVFALGIVLWEMLTGRYLFQRESEQETCSAVKNDPIISPSQINPALPEDLSTVVMKSLERVPAERYSNAYDMELALVDFVSKQTTKERPPTLASYLQRLSIKESAAKTVKAKLRPEPGPSPSPSPRTPVTPPHPHPHRRLVRELTQKANGGGDNHLCLPATPGLLLERAFLELRTTLEDKGGRLIEVYVSNSSDPTSLLGDMAKELEEAKVLRAPQGPVTVTWMRNRLADSRPKWILFWIQHIDLALNALAAPSQREELIRGLCSIGVPIVFTSMRPVGEWCLTEDIASPRHLEDIQPSQMADDWDGFSRRYALDDHLREHYTSECGGSPELFEALVHEKDINVLRKDYANEIWIRLPSLHSVLLAATEGNLDPLTDKTAISILKWARILDTCDGSLRLSDPLLGRFWSQKASQLLEVRSK